MSYIYDLILNLAHRLNWQVQSVPDQDQISIELDDLKLSFTCSKEVLVIESALKAAQPDEDLLPLALSCAKLNAALLVKSGSALNLEDRSVILRRITSYDDLDMLKLETLLERFLNDADAVRAQFTAEDHTIKPQEPMWQGGIWVN